MRNRWPWLALAIALVITAAVALVLPLGVVALGVSFEDTFSRNDVAPASDSLGTTEPGAGLVALDYWELTLGGGIPIVQDIGQIAAGSLFIRGKSGTTEPALVELDNAGQDLDFQIEAEFQSSDIAGSAAANVVIIGMRNSGVAQDGTVWTRGFVAFSLSVEGGYSLKGTVSDGGVGTISVFKVGTLDAQVLATADLDGDGLLEMGEPFTIRLVLEGNSLSLSVDGISQLADFELSGLPDPAADADRLLIGRNTTSGTEEVEIRYDNLLGGAPTATPIPSVAWWGLVGLAGVMAALLLLRFRRPRASGRA